MVQPTFTPPPPVRPGDRIAVVSLSGGLPELFPAPYELGLRRLRSVFGLEPVEYPSTRLLRSTPRQRADDLHTAFADPSVAAVLASIGGEDQITVLPLLDRELIGGHPKRFLGYSDNTNLLAFLWNTGIVGYHGGSVMCELGRPGAMAPLTEESLRAALFTSGPYELRPPERFGEVNRPWDDPATFTAEPETGPAPGWCWHGPWEGPGGVVEGRTWGGCLEVVARLLADGREIARDPAAYDNCVLFLETSEELPSAEEVFRLLGELGERGLLGRFSALLMGRARAWSLAERRGAREREEYRRAQREAVLRALSRYAPRLPVVFGVDLGHTDPQLVVPYGGVVRVDGPARRITVRY
ncbi:S66 peptidase family protein [Streptomyces sp. NPDC058045]|uniref:S66 family peptidase n=1 Tax=Streptomyces sp. NPDC058045 TaxID=3346311 RepID=UPI0036ECCECC